MTQYQRLGQQKPASFEQSAAVIKPGALALEQRDRRFYVVVAAVFSAIVFAGFARTYYLRTVFTDRPLTALLHIHGLVFTCWLVLLLLQTILVAIGWTDIHRRVGVAGGVLASVMIVLGPIVAVHAAKRKIGSGMPAFAELMFLAIPLGDTLVFSILVAAGFLYRRKPEIHKRLMLLATIGILPPAIARLPLAFIQSAGAAGYFGLADIVFLSCVAYDVATRRRVHPAYLWGGLVILASQPLRLAISRTGVWLIFARWLAS